MKKVLAIAIVSLSALAGCSGGGEATHTHEEAHHHAPNGDLRETTSSLETLPTFLDGQQAIVKDAYRVAAANAELLEWIPCYCGCGQSAAHLNNKNCFIHEIREDGTVVWDDHGTRCGVCLQIAIESAVMAKDGMSTKEIRDAIEQKYEGGTGAPTPTPMPS
ncbi:PCYCGC domain-containing protein [Paenibacillus sp. TRM 82003]|nr:PCYCGC domain-containing protein [Paenibacillus sp. TRM 82003]